MKLQSINLLQKIKKPLLPLAMTTLLTIGGATLNAQNQNNTTTNNSNTSKINITQSDNYLIYRNLLDGTMVRVGIIDKATISLYSAVQKHSSNFTTDIVDIGGFYADVESNIPKNEVGVDSYNLRQTNDIEDINKNNKMIISTLRHIQCSQLFNKLFEIFTSERSEKGSTITKNEYVKMMDAWSSTGY